MAVAHWQAVELSSVQVQCLLSTVTTDSEERARLPVTRTRSQRGQGPGPRTGARPRTAQWAAAAGRELVPRRNFRVAKLVAVTTTLFLHSSFFDHYIPAFYFPNQKALADKNFK